MAKLIDHTGKIFHDWKVLSYVGRKNSGRPLWECKCICGIKKEVIADNLVRGLSKGCGCTKSDKLRESKITHGMSDTDEYNIWLGIKNRCTLPTCSSYNKYGGAGVTLCNRWLTSFENFYIDMGRRPSKKHTVERIDCYKGYSPDNCVWVHQKLQSRNKKVRIDNKTGVTGVVEEEGRYKAKWKDLSGIQKSKSFSINKYGKEEAFLLACEAREDAIKELNKQGAGYSDNHGK